jgi:hypothetical protein
MENQIEPRRPGRPRKHKNLDCACIPCTRRREGEARAIAAGAGGLPVEPKRRMGRSEKKIEIVKTSGRSPRDRIAEWAMLRATEPGITNIEVARRLGISTQSLNSLISKASREGWLVFDDPIDSIDFQLIPKVMKNLNTLLDQVDRTTTLETAKGTIFKSYQNAKGISDTIQTVLALKLEAVPTDTRVVEGQVVGMPRQLEE